MQWAGRQRDVLRTTSARLAIATHGQLAGTVAGVAAI